MHGVSHVMIDAWRKRIGRLGAVDVKRLRHIWKQNSTTEETVGGA